MPRDPFTAVSTQRGSPRGNFALVFEHALARCERTHRKYTVAVHRRSPDNHTPHIVSPTDVPASIGATDFPIHCHVIRHSFSGRSCQAGGTVDRPATGHLPVPAPPAVVRRRIRGRGGHAMSAVHDILERLARRNLTVVASEIWISAPVAGLRHTRAARAPVENAPKPISGTVSPLVTAALNAVFDC